MNKSNSIFGLGPVADAPAPSSDSRHDDTRHGDSRHGDAQGDSGGDAGAPKKLRRRRSRRSRKPGASTGGETQAALPLTGDGGDDDACEALRPDADYLADQAEAPAKPERGRGGRRARTPKAPKPVVVPLAPVREGAELGEEYQRAFATEEIMELPLIQFVGKIILVESDRQLHQAMKVLHSQTLLGFDTETRPIFKKGKIPPPALLQLATDKDVYIFQLPKLADKHLLTEILASRTILKSGVSVRDDLKGLKEHFEFTEHGFVDLGDVAKKLNMRTHGLRNLTANLLGKRISKGAQCSNWARESLSTKQIIYAATDAWISRELYLRFVELDVL